MADLVTFGETMLRMSPPWYRRLEQASSFDVYAGGSEMSIAIGARRLGISTAWVSRLPDNALGKMVRNKAREHDVDTSHIIWAPADERVGIYFMEYGAEPRPSSVIYDRAHSAISRIQPGEVNWDKAFAGAKVFFVSGITPALSDSAAEVTLEALAAAKKHKLTTAIDLNYRAKLWPEEKAQAVMTRCMDYCDILITTEEDTARVFKITAGDYETAAHKLKELFSLKAVAVTLRENISVLKNNWTAIVLADKLYRDRTYEIEVIDRVGAGDSFSAGFIYGWLTDGPERGLKAGNAFSALKHSHPGDMNWTTLTEVEKLISSAGGGRIER